AAELRHGRTDEPGRVAPDLVERERDHRRGRPLAVRPGDDDRAAEPDEPGEELGARHPRNARIGGRDDGLPALGADGLRRDLDLDAREPGEVRGPDAAPPPPLRAPGAGELRVGGEPGTADPDEPEAAPLKRSQARSAPRRSPRPRRASPPAASPGS